MNEKRGKRSWGQRLILLMNLMLIAAALGAAALLQYGYQQATSINRVALDRSLTAVPESAEVGERVLNILLVGSDSSARLDPNDPVQIGRQGERFGDVIIVAHVDERTRQVALLSFPRDLWVPLAGTNRSNRINRAFEIGGPSMLIDSIEATFDIPIHHYVNVDFAGFQGLVEAVGSVDVFFDTPARDWNVAAKPEPRSQTGFAVTEAGCHSLDPPTALAYVRSRYYQTQDADGRWQTDPSSDFGRIRRQQDFLRRLMHRAIDLGARNPFVLNDLIEAGLDNVAIDQELTPQLLVDLGAAYQGFNPDELQTYSIPATDALINGNQVLQTDWANADPILALMRGDGFTDPSTINLSVASQVGSDDGQSVASDLRRGLRVAGFTVEETTISDNPAGITISHGPDGLGAATVVQAAVGLVDVAAVTVEMDESLPGRNIRIDVGFLTPSGGLGAPGNPAAAAANEEIDPITSVDGGDDRTPGTSTLVSGPVDAQVPAGLGLQSEAEACR